MEYMDKFPKEQYWNQRIMNGMSNCKSSRCLCVFFRRCKKQRLRSLGRVDLQHNARPEGQRDVGEDAVDHVRRQRRTRVLD